MYTEAMHMMVDPIANIHMPPQNDPSTTIGAKIAAILPKKLVIPSPDAAKSVGNTSEFAMYRQLKIEEVPNLASKMSSGKTSYALSTVQHRIIKQLAIVVSTEKVTKVLTVPNLV